MTLPLTAELLLAACIFLGAALYSSVGHAGASSYLALMALFGVPAATMRPTALVLNVLVASLASVRYTRVGLFRWRVLWPVLLGAVPMAVLGGAVHLPGAIYRPLVGAILLLAAARLLWPAPIRAMRETRDPPIFPAALAGAVIGILSGLTATGGGIFLSPLLLFLGWCEVRPASGVAAVFILCNSAAGLAGNLASVGHLPADLPLFAAAALLGGVVGTTLGIGRFATPAIIKALGAVLVIAGLKLFDLF